MDQWNRELRKETQVIIVILLKKKKEHRKVNDEKTMFSTNGVKTNGHPHAK